jgi:hypothetical protein
MYIDQWDIDLWFCDLEMGLLICSWICKYSKSTLQNPPSKFPIKITRTWSYEVKEINS